MAKEKKTYSPWERFYQKLHLIFNGIITLTMIPFGLYFLHLQKNPDLEPLVPEAWVDTLKVTGILMSLAVIVLVNKLAPKWISAARAMPNTEAKLSNYLLQKVKQYALITLAGVIVLLHYYLLREGIFAVVYIGVLFVFSMHRPGFSRVCKEIGMKEDDVINWSKGETDVAE